MRLVTDEDQAEVQLHADAIFKIAEPTRQLLLKTILNADGTVNLDVALACFLSHISVHVMKIRHLETRVGLLEVKLLAQNGIDPGTSHPLRIDLNPSPLPTESES